MSDETDDFTPDEKAYFESGGEQTTAPKPEPAQQAPEGQETASVEEIEVDEIPEGGEPTEPGAPRDDRVPLKTLLKEREAAKEHNKRREEADRRAAVLEDRLNQILQAQQQAQQKPAVEEDPEPNPNEDIFAHQAWLSRQHRKVVEANEQRQQTERQQQERQQLDSQVSTFWSQSAAAFKETQPDFDDAANFLAMARDKELTAQAMLNPALATPEGRRAVMAQELHAINLQAAQVGISPAEYVYKLAHQRGYKLKAAETQQQGGATQEIANLAAAVDASKSLGAVAGGRGTQTTADAIANMSDADFAKWFEKNGQEGFRKIAGRVG